VWEKKGFLALGGMTDGNWCSKSVIFYDNALKKSIFTRGIEGGRDCHGEGRVSQLYKRRSESDSHLN